MRNASSLPKAVGWCHQLLKDTFREGFTAIDATAGNGYDTLFLVQQTGPDGHVFAFDIQQKALDSTAKLLAENNVPTAAFTLIRASHAHLETHLPQQLHKKVSVVMFNLGFLPSGDKSLITEPATTISALAAASRVLERGGILSVIAYPGHPFGNDEALSVEKWMSALAPDAFEVQTIKAVNRVQPAPELWLARVR
jgi:predicted methyltransferase